MTLFYIVSYSIADNCGGCDNISARFNWLRENGFEDGLYHHWMKSDYKVTEGKDFCLGFFLIVKRYVSLGGGYA